MSLLDQMSDEVKEKLGLTSGNDFSSLFFILMKELHISYFELMEMPLPAIIVLLDELERFYKKQKKSK